MATLNPFDLLVDDDSEDPSLLIAAQKQKIEAKKDRALSGKPAAAAKNPVSQNKPSNPSARMPSKPLPPNQAVVKEERSESARGGRGAGRGYGRGRGAGGGVPYRDSANNENSYSNRDVSSGQIANDDADDRKLNERRSGYGGPRPFRGDRGGRRGDFSNGEVGDGERGPRRSFDRRSGTGRGNDLKREGAGRGNWGTQTDELAQVTEEAANEDEKPMNDEKPAVEEEPSKHGDKEAPAVEVEKKEPEAKEMTLEEYERVLEEKRKALVSEKAEERKVDVKVFESMQQLSNKKANDDIFIKLGSDKDKKKELAEKEERAKKSVSINEFLKPADGARSYNAGGRGRGRGRGSRGGYSGGSEFGNNGGGYSGGSEFGNNLESLAIEDPGQFPSLGGK